MPHANLRVFITPNPNKDYCPMKYSVQVKKFPAQVPPLATQNIYKHHNGSFFLPISWDVPKIEDVEVRELDRKLFGNYRDK